MDVIQHYLETPKVTHSVPSCVARYRPVFWEPIPGTGERIVALIAIEPHESTQAMVTASTYCVLPGDRLKVMLGRQRGKASEGLLKEVAEFMTAHQRAGLPLADLEPPFHGFLMAPLMTCRGYDVDQMLNAAVRSVSAFGNPDIVIDEEASTETPRSTVKTAEFLKNLKRYVAGEDSDVKARFDKKFSPSKKLPDLTIDYAFNKWVVQVTSLPATERQAHHSLREAQSKLFEIDVLRDEMQGNTLRPILLVNEDVLQGTPSPTASAQASRMLERLQQLATVRSFELLQARTPEDGAKLVQALR